MVVKNEMNYYTLGEVSKITCFGRKRIYEAMEKRILVPTDIEKSKGRRGFRYLFSEEDINRYAEKIGIEPRWERLNEDNTEHARAEIKARQETRKILYPQDNEIVITADNVEEVFRQIQGGKKAEIVEEEQEPAVEVEEEATHMYVVKLGKAFITTTKELSINFDSKCWMDKKGAETLINLFGGKLMQVYVRDDDGR